VNYENHFYRKIDFLLTQKFYDNFGWRPISVFRDCRSITMNILRLIFPLVVATLAAGWQVPFVGRDYGACHAQMACERDDLFLTTVSQIP
jgi:hypothetical protein